jgi:D-alanyl-D-alanine carboxypeptidase
MDPPTAIEGNELPFESDFGVKFVKYPMNWHNSNKLLTVPGFKGVKTGITQTAGSCLSVYFENEDCKLVTVVLGCRNIEYRWKDTHRLTLWAASVIKHN